MMYEGVRKDSLDLPLSQAHLWALEHTPAQRIKRLPGRSFHARGRHSR